MKPKETLKAPWFFVCYFTLYRSSTVLRCGKTTPDRLLGKLIPTQYTSDHDCSTISDRVRAGHQFQKSLWGVLQKHLSCFLGNLLSAKSKQLSEQMTVTYSFFIHWFNRSSICLFLSVHACLRGGKRDKVCRRVQVQAMPWRDKIQTTRDQRSDQNNTHTNEKGQRQKRNRNGTGFERFRKGEDAHKSLTGRLKTCDKWERDTDWVRGRYTTK